MHSPARRCEPYACGEEKGRRAATGISRALRKLLKLENRKALVFAG
jgi:hypothetical protein